MITAKCNVLVYNMRGYFWQRSAIEGHPLLNLTVVGKVKVYVYNMHPDVLFTLKMNVKGWTHAAIISAAVSTVQATVVAMICVREQLVKCCGNLLCAWLGGWHCQHMSVQCPADSSLILCSWCDLSVDYSCRQADFMGIWLVLCSGLQSPKFSLRGLLFRVRIVRVMAEILW